MCLFSYLVHGTVCRQYQLAAHHPVNTRRTPALDRSAGGNNNKDSIITSMFRAQGGGGGEERHNERGRE